MKGSFNTAGRCQLRQNRPGFCAAERTLLRTHTQTPVVEASLCSPRPQIGVGWGSCAERRCWPHHGGADRGVSAAEALCDRRRRGKTGVGRQARSAEVGSSLGPPRGVPVGALGTPCSAGSCSLLPGTPQHLAGCGPVAGAGRIPSHLGRGAAAGRGRCGHAGGRAPASRSLSPLPRV